MKPFFSLLKLVAQLLVALFAVDSVVTHFNIPSQDPLIHNIDTQLVDQSTNHGTSPQKHDSSWSHLVYHEMTSSKSHTRYVTTSTISHGGIKRYTLTRNPASNEHIPDHTLLYLTLTRDGESWGRNPTEPQRNISSFLDMISDTTLSHLSSSVGILTSSSEEFNAYKNLLTESLGKAYNFARVTLVFHPGPGNTASAASSTETAGRNARHNIPQHTRRSTLAKLRNYLQLTALAHETHLLWIDSDVYRFSSADMPERMVNITSAPTPTRNADGSPAEVGILTANCRMGDQARLDEWKGTHLHLQAVAERTGDTDGSFPETEGLAWGRFNGGYDLNSWSGERAVPTEEQDQKLHDPSGEGLAWWEPHPVARESISIIDRVIEGSSDDEVRRIDSVGGTVLMIKADLVRMGLAFPTGYYIGTSWKYGEGYDGIETEGLCPMSRSLSTNGMDSLCWTMGGSWAVWHTIF